MSSAAFEENAEREIRLATAKAGMRHMAPTLIPTLAGVLIGAITWTLAVVGALSLTMPLTLLGLAVPLAGLIYMGQLVVRGVVKTAEKRRAEADMTPGERFEASKAALKNEAAARRQRTLWSRYRRRGLWLPWMGLTLPKSVLVVVAVALWLPRPAAIAAGAVSALWTFFTVWLDSRASRVDQFATLFTAEGDKPTPEI